MASQERYAGALTADGQSAEFLDGWWTVPAYSTRRKRQRQPLGRARVASRALRVEVPQLFIRSSNAHDHGSNSQARDWPTCGSTLLTSRGRALVQATGSSMRAMRTSAPVSSAIQTSGCAVARGRWEPSRTRASELKHYCGRPLSGPPEQLSKEARGARRRIHAGSSGNSSVRSARLVGRRSPARGR